MGVVKDRAPAGGGVKERLLIAVWIGICVVSWIVAFPIILFAVARALVARREDRMRELLRALRELLAGAAVGAKR